MTSTATTDYGTWHNLMGGTTRTIDDYVREALDDESDYDVDAIVTEYRDAINEVLPDRVTLNGNDLYGPYPRQRRVAGDGRGDRGDRVLGHCRQA